MQFNAKKRYSAGVAVAGLAAITLSAGPVAADVDFSGQRIEAIVPFGEGGGADTYSRYMVRELGRHLPGTPDIVVRNMPGGGSVNGANWFHQNANADGTHIAIASTSTTLTFALSADDDRIQFSVPDWNAFIASPMGRVIYVHESTGITGIEDLADFEGELLIGLQSPTGSDLPSIMSIHMLGINARPVFGTDGGDAALAFERGELNLETDVASAYLQQAMPLVEAGTIVPLFTFGFDQDGEIVRDPNFPDLPSFPEAYEMVHGEPPSGPGWDAWQALFHIAVMSSKAMVLPEGTPQEIIDAYSEAAAAMVQDEQFLTESGALVGEYPQLTGDAAQRSLMQAVTISPEAREYVVDYVRERFNIEL